MVLLGPLTKPANDLPILFTEEQEFLSMVSTEMFLLLLQAQFDLPDPLHYVGQVPIRPQFPRFIIDSAHRALSRPLLASHRLLAVSSNADLAETVATVHTDGILQEIQAHWAPGLLAEPLPRGPRGHGRLGLAWPRR